MQSTHYIKSDLNHVLTNPINQMYCVQGWGQGKVVDKDWQGRGCLLDNAKGKRKHAESKGRGGRGLKEQAGRGLRGLGRSLLKH